MIDYLPEVLKLELLIGKLNGSMVHNQRLDLSIHKSRLQALSFKNCIIVCIEFCRICKLTAQLLSHRVKGITKKMSCADVMC